MTIKLGLIVGGVAGVFLFVWWVIRRNKKAGRMEADHERQVKYSETIGNINEMERLKDGEKKPDFGDPDTARGYLGGMHDKRDDG
ncbi:MAG: hypothetical protein GWM98_11585 [Nitrospinaceae bacterium]|nr:hypothetical protein [Nitrospinaceae bacterium]NIR55025.1 hypothetical protein [Nitrospinaceae bacterium]NIS85424.1 hypothetical protein [Nitrospinaceae bacterium]NIT82263.1 hypothetical protein [Nitrospinaceae bacterium]NIU44493.1 hypothetical protein [Nitrospinaceae bacterium]